MADFLLLYIQVLGIILITAIVVAGLFVGVLYTYETLEEKLSEGWAMGGTTLILLILLSILKSFIIHIGGGSP